MYMHIYIYVLPQSNGLSWRRMQGMITFLDFSYYILKVSNVHQILVCTDSVDLLYLSKFCLLSMKLRMGPKVFTKVDMDVVPETESSLVGFGEKFFWCSILRSS